METRGGRWSPTRRRNGIFRTSLDLGRTDVGNTRTDEGLYNREDSKQESTREQGTKCGPVCGKKRLGRVIREVLKVTYSLYDGREELEKCMSWGRRSTQEECGNSTLTVETLRSTHTDIGL